MNTEMIAATGNEQKMVEIRQILASSGIRLITMKDAGLDLDIVENGTTFEENALLKARAVAASSGKMAIADDSGLVVDAMGGEPGIHSARWMGHDTTYDIKNREIIRLVDEYCAKMSDAVKEDEFAGSDGSVRIAGSDRSVRIAGSDGSVRIAGSNGSAGSAGPGSMEGAEEILLSGDAASVRDSVPHPGCDAKGVPGPLRSARFVCSVAVVWPDGKERTATGVLEGRIHSRQCGTNGFGYDPIFFLPEYGMTSGQIPREEKNRISHRGQAFRKIREILEKEIS